MSNYIYTMVFLCLSLISTAQIQIPAISPLQEISQKIGLTTVSIDYSRPHLRGRSLFGPEGILAKGERWRTGANAVTKFEATHNIDLNKRTLTKGTYALLTTPQEATCTFHFFTYEKRGYTYFLDKEPVLEITIPATKSPISVESLTLSFEDVRLDAATLVLQWADYRVGVPLEVDNHDEVMASINKTLGKPSSFDYFQAALYLHETETDLPLALTYIRKANEGDKPLFFQVFREALILRDLGRNTEALPVAKRALKFSEEAGNQDFVRLSRRLMKELY